MDKLVIVSSGVSDLEWAFLGIAEWIYHNADFRYFHETM